MLHDLGVISKKAHDIKVISVGNITTGGTGKTPLVEMITEFLIKENKKVAIISRGYKAFQGNMGLIADEPHMLKVRYPQAQVIINKDRFEAIRLAAQELGCEIAVLDDAFQNFKVKKDLDIVCIDCSNPFGFGYVLPRGLLRLPLSYLKNANLFVLTHADIGAVDTDEITAKIRNYNKNAPIFKSSHRPEYLYNILTKAESAPASLKEKNVALFCGIARPELFARTVESLGARISERFYFEDHHSFTEKELNSIIDSCTASNIDSIITTAKDEPRIKAVLKNKKQKIEILVLRIKLRIENNEGRFLDSISALFTD